MSLSEFRTIIAGASPEQRQNLQKLTGSLFGSDPDTLCNHMRYLRAGSVGQLWWKKSWKQLVTDVADHIKIDWLATFAGRRWQQLESHEIEAAVVNKLFQNMLDLLTPEQREKLVMETKHSSDDPRLEDIFLTGAAMGAARANGFGIYLMASTLLGGLTSSLGITLPFAVYMGMSQTIALIIGPVGWLALAGGLVFKLNQPNWNRLTLAVVYISVIRHGPSGGYLEGA